MPSTLSQFTQYHPRLFGIAYRMLGSRADAEDVLQDAYLRWHGADQAELRSVEAWLVTLVTRLSIDRLRGRQREGEHYPGPWLPEPLGEADWATPEAALEFSRDVSYGLLVLLERLSAEERAAFLLREVFDHDYPEVAALLGKSEAACRQLVHRGRQRIGDERRRFAVAPEAHRRVLEKFMAAARSGDRTRLHELLAEDATMTADGGGKAQSVNKVLQGAERIARLYYALARNRAGELLWQAGTINGRPGILRYRGGALHSAMVVESDGERVLRIYAVLNPDKLRGLAA